MHLLLTRTNGQRGSVRKLFSRFGIGIHAGCRKAQASLSLSPGWKERSHRCVSADARAAARRRYRHRLETGRKPFDLSGSCHPPKAAAFRRHQGIHPD
jgi:hypothetical protein